MALIEQLSTTLQGLAGPGIKRKELIAAVREKHPKASKKDIVRAAFYALTTTIDGDVECAATARIRAERAGHRGDRAASGQTRQEGQARRRASEPTIRPLNEAG